jgi:hypothetical protein
MNESLYTLFERTGKRVIRGVSDVSLEQIWGFVNAMFMSCLTNRVD